MNREILFRGKRIDDGEWVEGYLVEKTDFDSGEVCQSYIIEKVDFGRNADDDTRFCDIDEIEVLSETIVQFTGLTDKSGDKIFEGDIVKCENFIGEVIYRGDGFCIKNIPQSVDKSSWYIFNNCKVIGNIYDNPELLTYKT